MLYNNELIGDFHKLIQEANTSLARNIQVINKRSL